MRTNRIEIRLTDAELRALSDCTNATNINRSEYLRRCMLGKKISSRLDYEAVQDLMKINADLARLGNALMLCMTNLADCLVKDRDVYIEELNNLKNDIRTEQERIKKIALAFKT